MIIVFVFIVYIFIQIVIPAIKGAGTALKVKKKLERR